MTSETIINQLIGINKPKTVSRWSYSNRTWTFTFRRVELELEWCQDSMRSFIFDSEVNVPRKALDPLRTSVRGLLNDAQNVDFSRDYEVAILILNMVEYIDGWECERSREVATHRQPQNWHVDEINDWDWVVNKPGSLDISTIVDTAYQFLQQTPEDICRNIPQEWRVIHIENVLRQDLIIRFWRHKQVLQVKAESRSTSFLQQTLPPHSILGGRVRARVSREDLIEDMIRPRTTFHGTPLVNVSSIVRHGFKLPRSLVDGRVVASPRTGIAYDRGIYSSQSPAYALSYAAGQRQKTPLGVIPSMRLFVCATLMGSTFSAARRPGYNLLGTPIEGYDAQFDGSFEYIVHEEKAMLPCYVIHLDLGSQAAQRALLEVQDEPDEFHARKQRKPVLLRDDFTSPGDKKREQERKKAAALKWFPYGFGSAKGTNFKIEEVGEISDDEEEYGEWQTERHAFIRSEDDESFLAEEKDYYGTIDETGEVVTKKKGAFLDQYQSARVTGLRGRS